jgi:hypothetical protein
MGRQLTDPETNDPSLWFHVWDEVPNRLEPYPAFYFPRLPASLTGLDSDLLRLPELGATQATVNLRAMRLPTVDARQRLDDAEDEEAFYSSRSVLLNVEGNLIMSGDLYGISGQAGAVGPRSVASGNTFNQYVDGLNIEQMTHLAAELETLREAMRARADSPEEDMAVAEIARAEVAAGSNDKEGLQSALMKAGRWAWDIANSIGTSIAEAALKAALGL